MIVRGEKAVLTFVKGLKGRHVAKPFRDVTKKEIDANRPVIEGVNPIIARLLGEHKDVQNWDFVEMNGVTYLLIPKRYALFSVWKLGPIRLVFGEGFKTEEQIKKWSEKR